MKIKDFYELVELSKEPEASLLPNLQYRIKKYPYFQADIFIYLKCLYSSSSEDFMDELSRLSPFISDRKALFYYIMNDQYGLFRKKIEQSLNSDRTNILISAFFDTLDESDIESALDNLINKPSLASTDYFAYLDSLNVTENQEINKTNSFIESILPDAEIYLADAKFEEVEYLDNDKKRLTINNSESKERADNLGTNEVTNNDKSITYLDEADNTKIEDELEVEDSIDIDFHIKVLTKLSNNVDNRTPETNIQLDRLEYDEQVDTDNKLDTSIGLDDTSDEISGKQDRINDKLSEDNSQTIDELKNEYLSNVDYRIDNIQTQPEIAQTDYLKVDDESNKEIGENKTPKLKHQDIIDRFITLTKDQDNLRIQLEPSDEEYTLDEEDYDLEAPATEEDLEKNFFFSQTLANIYIKQKKYERAYEIIKHLSLNYPEKSIYFADQLSFLDKLIKHKNINK